MAITHQEVEGFSVAAAWRAVRVVRQVSDAGRT